MKYHTNKKGDIEYRDNGGLFKVLKAYNDNQALIAASISGTGSEEKLPLGLIGGHAYTVLRIEFVDPSGGGFLGLGGAPRDDFLKMVQLRNPWGKGEWEGDWSDNSPMWKKYPKVAKTLKDSDQNQKAGGDNDGIFWMLWEDFVKHYNNIEVCDRKQSLRDLTLEVHEEDGPCGICCGCVGGCCEYYCCCVGCHKLYCVRKPTPVTIGDEENGTRM
jgi:calpain-15